MLVPQPVGHKIGPKITISAKLGHTQFCFVFLFKTSKLQSSDTGELISNRPESEFPPHTNCPAFSARSLSTGQRAEGSWGEGGLSSFKYATMASSYK